METVGIERSETREWTVADLERLPEDGTRYELVAGRLEVSPAPVSLHTLIESRLTIHLGANAPDEHMVLTGPRINLNAAGTHHRIPDVAVIRAEDFERPYLRQPPLLVIEVVSPESVFRDHHTKAREYAEFGIPSYWIVNPVLDKPSIVELRLHRGTYREAAQVFDTDVFATKEPFPIRVVPHWLVNRGPWREHIGGTQS